MWEKEANRSLDENYYEMTKAMVLLAARDYVALLYPNHAREYLGKWFNRRVPSAPKGKQRIVSRKEVRDRLYRRFLIRERAALEEFWAGDGALIADEVGMKWVALDLQRLALLSRYHYGDRQHGPPQEIQIENYFSGSVDRDRVGYKDYIPIRFRRNVKTRLIKVRSGV